MSFCGKFIKCRLFSKKKTKRRPKIGIWSAFRLKAVKQTIVSALVTVAENINTRSQYADVKFL